MYPSQHLINCLRLLGRTATPTNHDARDIKHEVAFLLEALTVHTDVDRAIFAAAVMALRKKGQCNDESSKQKVKELMAAFADHE